ncbi:hypothetical protein GCM10022251_54060 [Phytohabitans flavus]
MSVNVTPLTADELAYVDELAKCFGLDGYPFETARVVGYLLISDPPAQSVEEIAEAIGRTKEQVAEDAALIKQFGLAEPSPTDETKLRIRPSQWSDILSGRREGLAQMSDLLAKGMELLPPDPARLERLEFMAELYGFFAARIPALMNEWQEHITAWQAARDARVAA